MADYDPPFWRWPVWVGNNPPLTFALTDDAGAAINLAGVSLRLRVSWPGGTLAMDSGEAGFMILPQSGLTVGQFEITLTLAQTRLLPATGPALYEIEQRVGGEELTILQGEMVCSGGGNTDG
jgi:hypothetical protein